MNDPGIILGVRQPDVVKEVWRISETLHFRASWGKMSTLLPSCLAHDTRLTDTREF